MRESWEISCREHFHERPLNENTEGDFGLIRRIWLIHNDIINNELSNLEKTVVHYLVLIISAKIKQILLVHCLRSLAASIGNLEAILQLRLVAKQAQKL